jgi:hypothetical protein
MVVVIHLSDRPVWEGWIETTTCLLTGKPTLYLPTPRHRAGGAGRSVTLPTASALLQVRTAKPGATSDQRNHQQF